MNKNSLETIELELTILIRRITSINKKFGDLERSEYLLLHQLITNGPAGVKSLADDLNLDISTVSRQTGALEQKGFVYRTPDPQDRRAYFLQITDNGVKEFNKSKQARLAKISGIVKNWSSEERELFGNLLHKYNQSILYDQTEES